MNKKLIPIIVGLVIIVGGYFVAKNIYQTNTKEELSFLARTNSQIFVRDYSPRYGNHEAKVYLIEYLDPECESCRKFYPQVKSLLEMFKGKVQLVVRYAPFHQNSQIAIRALEAARMQGKYWEALELLFEKQPEWGNHHNPRPELIFDFLQSLNLNMERLKKDMESPLITKMIEQDYEDLRILNVRGTPSFYVNGRPLLNFGIGPLTELVKEEVEKAYK